MVKDIIKMVVFIVLAAVVIFGNAMAWAEDAPEWTQKSYYRDGGFIYGVGICDAKAISNQALVRTTAINRARIQIAKAAFAIYNNGITLAIGEVPAMQMDGYWDAKEKVQYVLCRAPEAHVQNLIASYKKKLEEQKTAPPPADIYAGKPDKPSALPPGYPQLQFPTQTPFGKSWEGDEERRDIEDELSGFGMPR